MTNRTDNFNRSDGAIGTPSDGGAAWVEVSGTEWVVDTNRAGETEATITRGLAVLEASAANVDVEATYAILTNTPNNPELGLSARYVDTSNYLFTFIYVALSSWRLRKNVAGSITEEGSFSGAVTAGDVVRLECNGSAVKVYQNDVERISATIANHSSNTQHGFYAHLNSGPDAGRWDDFSITELGGGGGDPNRIRFPAQTSAMGVGGMLGGSRVY